MLLFLMMLLGASWYEPNKVIAATELAASIAVVALGFVGWRVVVRGR